MAQIRHTDDYDASPTQAQIERQVRWEISANEAGVKRYRQELVEAKVFADTSPGRRLVCEAMPNLIAHFAAVQEALTDQQANSAGKPREWWAYFGMLPAEKLAFIAVNSALVHGGGRHFLKGRIPATKLTAYARGFIRSVETQVSYEKWVLDDRAAAREAKKADQPYKRQLEALKRRVKKVDSRAYKRWMARLERAWRQPWPEAERVAFASAVAHHLVDCCGDLFELALAPKPGGRSEYYLQLTPRAIEILEDHNARAEVAQPPQRPMLCRPKPWVFTGERTCSTTEDTTSVAPKSCELA